MKFPWKSLLPGILFLLVGCKEQELLKNLDQTQANEIISLLQRNNIEAHKKDTAKEGYIVGVGKADFSTAVDLMNTYGLPSKPRIEIAQMFPSDSLISSPRAEKARLYSGIEQRLEQSLLTMSYVVSSRVHVSYDLNSSEGERKMAPVHLSALVKYQTEAADTGVIISDIKRFLKNSFENVNYDDISVVLTKAPTTSPPRPFVINQGVGNGFLSMLGVLAFLLVGSVAAVFLYRRKKEVQKVAADENDTA